MMLTPYINMPKSSFRKQTYHIFFKALHKLPDKFNAIPVAK